jgi:hypothetical protein
MAEILTIFFERGYTLEEVAAMLDEPPGVVGIMADAGIFVRDAAGYLDREVADAYARYRRLLKQKSRLVGSSTADEDEEE